MTHGADQLEGLLADVVRLRRTRRIAGLLVLATLSAALSVLLTHKTLPGLPDWAEGLIAGAIFGLALASLFLGIRKRREGPVNLNGTPEENLILARVSRTIELRLIFALGVVVLSTIAGLLTGHAVLNGDPWLHWWAQGAAFVGLVVLVGFGLKQTVPEEAKAPNILSLRSDDIQRKRRIICLVYAIYVGLITTTRLMDLRAPKAEHASLGLSYLSDLAMIFITVTYLAILTGALIPKYARRLFSDELSLAHRTLAIETSLLTALIVGTGLTLLSRADAPIALGLMPLIVPWTVAAGLLRFAWLDWRAEHDG